MKPRRAGEGFTLVELLITIVIIAIICFVAFVIFFVLKFLKEQKIGEILANIGHKNITNVKVVSKLNVEDMQTKMKSSVFKVVFFDLCQPTLT